jgi:single-strand DNA-binding protein
MYLNKAFVFGNLTRDPELKSLPSGSKVASFSLATNRVFKAQDGSRKEQTEFHNIVLFGKQAELAAQYLRKGSSALIEGRIQTRSWDAEGGKKYRTEIVADSMQFGPRTSGNSGSSVGEQSASSSAPSKKPKSAKESPSGEAIEYPEEEINPEDIPF